MERFEEFRPGGMEKTQYLALMHISQFAGMITGGLGFVLPLLMWLMVRDKDAEIDEHGKKIINWSISMFIYFFIAVLFSIVLIGVPFLLLLFVVSFIFPIIGAIRATHGELYQYPFTINFIQ